jgi:hypothetical protein
VYLSPYQNWRFSFGCWQVDTKALNGRSGDGCRMPRLHQHGMWQGIINYKWHGKHCTSVGKYKIEDDSDYTSWGLRDCYANSNKNSFKWRLQASSERKILQDISHTYFLSTTVIISKCQFLAHLSYRIHFKCFSCLTISSNRTMGLGTDSATDTKGYQESSWR